MATFGYVIGTSEQVWLVHASSNAAVIRETFEVRHLHVDLRSSKIVAP